MTTTHPRQIISLGLQRLCMLAALLTPLAPFGAAAEIIRKEDLLRGITMTPAQCAAKPQTVWVKSYGQDFCVRYYLSTAGGEGRRPIVILQGDQFGPIEPKTWTWRDLNEVKDIDTDRLLDMANSFSKMAKTTAIYLARIGVDGTSGNHLTRKTLLERELMNAALDAIKRRHGFEGFRLAGQSGGATLVGSLAELRNDVVCAVPGAGRLAALANLPTREGPSRTFFDPVADVTDLIRKPKLRLLVVTDSSDQRVPAKHQVTFVERVRQAGGTAEQFFVQATDSDHHDVLEYTRLVVSGCALGKSNADIARAADTVIRRNADWNAVRAAEAKVASNPPPSNAAAASRPTAPAPRTAASRRTK